MFFSPFSITMALTMAQMGAGGNTEEELKKALHYNKDKSQLPPALEEVIKDYQVL